MTKAERAEAKAARKEAQDAQAHSEAEAKATRQTRERSVHIRLTEHRETDSHFEAYRAKSGIWATRLVEGSGDLAARKERLARYREEDVWRRSLPTSFKARKTAGWLLLVFGWAIILGGAFVGTISPVSGVLTWLLALALGIALWFLSDLVKGEL
ncbi:MAG TPA: hypothetical protein VNM89_01310 [Solirubrobacterales bacterium]|nr:hypothetical protein [Solirubrobacterales bacterium]